MPDAAISIVGLTKRFGTQTIWEDITFDVPKGEISVILGPSGTGKSVLLKHFIGLLRPTAGHVYVDGKDIPRESATSFRDRPWYLSNPGCSDRVLTRGWSRKRNESP